MESTFVIFVAGSIIGLSIAAPIGPIGLLCIRRTIVDGFAPGLATGLGAATVHALLGALFGFGVLGLSAVVETHRNEFSLVAGLMFLWLGLQTLGLLPGRLPGGHESLGSTQAYISTVLLVLTNPVTLAYFGAVVPAAFSAHAGEQHDHLFALVMGVFAGSATWWLALSGGVSLVRRRLSPTVLLWFNRSIGSAIVAAGLAIVVVAAISRIGGR